MTGSEQREAARQFINRWRGKGKEDEDGRSYWIELLSNVFGVENVTERIDFEKKVVVDGNTKRIDVYIPETRVIIEQKSLNVPLNKKIRNSGDIDLTPFEQADRYNSKLIFDERARWIVTCNFAEIWIYDRAVMAAYGFSLKMSEEDCVAELMKLYQKILIAEKMKKVNKKSKKK